jgi:hypothetical protein
MKSTANAIRLQYDESGKPELTLTLSCSKQEAITGVQELKDMLGKGKVLSVELKQHRKGRSLDANAYMWTMCDKLAEKLSTPKSPMTKDDVYREAIRKVGQFTILPIRNDAVEQWIYNWGAGRTGWVCENLGDSKLEGYTNIMSYYGSSVYDSKSMARLIDYVVEECKANGIETLTPQELAALNEEWGK